LLNAEFEIEEQRFLDNIVYRKVQDDALYVDRRKYWMQARLKFVDAFEKMFSDIRLENLDFDVRVSTHEDIHTSVPRVFQRKLEIIVKWMGETNPEIKQSLSREHLRLLRARRGGSSKRREAILGLIQDLQDVFLPKTFRTFLKIEKHFHYRTKLVVTTNITIRWHGIFHFGKISYASTDNP